MYSTTDYKIGDRVGNKVCVDMEYGIDFSDENGQILKEVAFESEEARDAHWARLEGGDEEAWLHEDAVNVRGWSKPQWQVINYGMRRLNGTFRKNHEARYAQAGL